jgi:ferredoxin-nitrate reductase
MTRTAQVPRLLKQHPQALLEVHPRDGASHGLVDGGWAEVRSRRGAISARVQITDLIRPGTVFLPMHWGASQPNPCEANRLMHELACPHSKQPELKAAAVTLTPLPQGG